MKDNTVKKGRSVQFDVTLCEEQVIAKEQILRHPFSFILGRPGSGKTLLAVQIALDRLFKKEVSKIIIARPTVSTEDNGFIPGGFAEKLEPWLTPIRDNMRLCYAHPEHLVKLEQEGVIEIVPLSYFRGRTFKSAACIVDEVQNATKQQLIMAIGRLGVDSTMMFCGDYSQIDLRNPATSAIHLIDKIQQSRYVYVTTLKDNHRHPAVEELLEILLKDNSGT